MGTLLVPFGVFTTFVFVPVLVGITVDVRELRSGQNEHAFYDRHTWQFDITDCVRYLITRIWPALMGV